MANVIIGIHGLGNKPSKQTLEEWWIKSMQEGLIANNFKTTLPKFELVYWADIMYDLPLDETIIDVEHPLHIDEKYQPAPKYFMAEDHSMRKKIVDFLNRQLNRIFLNDDFSLNYSYITDIIVNKYFRDLEIYYTENCSDLSDKSCKAKDLIKGRLLAILEKYKNDNIMLVSHSMGSIIAFDVLSFDAPHIPVRTFVTMGSPLGLPIVISKIAAEEKRRLNDYNHMVTPPSVTKNWYNFADITDKIAFNYKLAESFSQNEQNVEPEDFLVENNYESNGKRNPHKSFGYLRTNEFAQILNDFIQEEKLSIKQRVLRKTTRIIDNVKAQIKAQVKSNI